MQHKHKETKETFDFDEYRDFMAECVGTGPKTCVFWNALALAEEAHRGQKRKSGLPYIAHPCQVARILAAELDMRSPDLLAAAILHDTVEDVKWVSSDLLARNFGRNVAAIVDGCTKVEAPDGDRQTQRKLVHRKIFSGAAARLEVMLVKLADRLHNMRTLGSMPAGKRQKIAEETLDIYAPLATILGLYDIKRELYNLALTHKFPSQSKPIMTRIRALRGDAQALDVVDNVRDRLAVNAIPAEVMLRTRELWAYYDPRNRILMERIENPQTIVIQTESRGACYRALGVLNSLYPPIPRTLRDFIANPKPTGYQGLHARANIGGARYLFKIRTAEMSRLARRGLVRDWDMNHKTGARFFEQIQEMFDIMGSDESVSYRELIAAGERKEIYTYTPAGDLVCLPTNSIVLDFAFSVHTELGLSCVGAMVGQRRAAPDERLRDGAMVRILTRDAPAVFDPEMLKLCRTPKARSEVAKTFRGRREEVSRQIGESVLRQELKRYGIPREILDKPGMAEILARFDLPDLPALLLALGEDRINLADLILEIRNRLYADHATLPPPTGELNRVNLSTLDPLVMKVSACCRPSPLDKGVIGLLSSRGLSLHRKDCPRLGHIHFRREEAVEARWSLIRTPVRKPQKLVVMRADRARLLEVAAAAPEAMRLLDLVCLGTDSEEAGKHDWELTFAAQNLRELQGILRHFRRSGLRSEFELEM